MQLDSRQLKAESQTWSSLVEDRTVGQDDILHHVLVAEVSTT